MEKLAQFLEREAGHVTVCLLIILFGAGFAVLQIPKAEDLIVFGLGALGRSMVGSAKLP